MPSRKYCRTSPAVCASVGINWIIPCISVDITLIPTDTILGSAFTMPATRFDAISPAAANILSAAPSESASDKLSTRMPVASGIVFANLGTISSRFLTTFWAAVTTDSANSSAVPEPFKKLSNDAFAAFIEPSIVVAASLAVVPVIPSSPCMTWMA